MIDPILLIGDVATAQLAQDIAMVAEPDWVIRLEGDLGAGKTTFARAFIRALADDPALDIPSPTYTLVQRYEEADPVVLHADLYRLSDPSEMLELGLDDPDDKAIRLVEWPQNAGEGAFPGAVTVSLALQDETARVADVSGPQPLLDRIERSLAIRAFLEFAGHKDTERRRLQGDASARRYERLADAALIVMDAPRQADGPLVKDGKSYNRLVHRAESVHAFAAIGHALRKNGFAAPALHAADLNAGLLLIENLGEETILLSDGTPNPERYRAAVELLATLHTKAWTPELPVPGNGTHLLKRYDTDVFLTEIAVCPDWYVAHRGVETGAFDRDGFFAAWRAALEPLDAEPSTLTLRDYHSPNIIWRENESGTDRMGLIDHQDALLGPPAYDIASLVQDARVTIPPDMQRSLLGAYGAVAGVDAGWLQARFTVMAAQRNTKILGIFARLNAQDHKPAYLKHLPRIEDYMHQLLTHPVLAQLRPYYEQLLPEPGQ